MLIKRRQLGINFAHPTARKIVSLWVVENGSWRDLYNRDLVASLVNGATIAKARSDRLSVARECLRLNQTANNAAILTSSRLSGQLGGKPCTAFVFANLIAVDSNGAFLAPALSCNTNVVSDVSCEVGSLTFDSTPKPRYIGYQVPSDGYTRYGYINGVLRGTRSTYPVVSPFPTGSFDFRWGSDPVSTFYDANAEIFMSGLGYGSMFGEADHALLWKDPFALTKVTRTTYLPLSQSLGTIYHVVYLDGETTPTKAQIISGLSWSPAKGAGSVGASASDTFTFTALSTLNPGTAYRVAYVYVGSPEDSEVLVSGVITTESGGTTYNVSRTEATSSTDEQEATWADVPVLSNPGAIDILALSARPQVTVTY